jgi:Short C-terminal domain
MPLRRRPVLRTVGRTAVIAGTASAVAGGVNRHQQQKYAAQDAAAEQQAYAEQAPPPAPAAAPPAASSDELINKLKDLAELKDQGILTEEEFSAQKAKILEQMS